MIGEILNAVLKETKAYVATVTDTGMQAATVMFKSNFRQKNMASYGLPLVLIDMHESPEYTAYIGNAKRADWVMAINTYNYEADALTDSTDFSTGLLNFIDLIANHFIQQPNSGLWLTPEMTAVEQVYGLKLDLSGAVPADALAIEDGLAMGWRIMFNSMAIDMGTMTEPYSTTVLETLAINGNNIIHIVPGSGPAIIIIMTGPTSIAIPADTFVPNIALNIVGGAPVVGIMDNDGNIIMAASPVTEFYEITAQKYFGSAGALLFDITGGVVVVRIDVQERYFAGTS